MQRSFLFLFVSLIFLSCSKEEPLNFRIYDLDIYSIPFDEEASQQEVYASVKVEGFKTIKQDSNFQFQILLEADLITPEGKKIESIAKLDSTGTQNEKFGEYLNLELSFILDQSFVHGNYKLILRGKDKLSNQTSQISQEFSLD